MLLWAIISKHLAFEIIINKPSVGIDQLIYQEYLHPSEVLCSMLINWLVSVIFHNGMHAGLLNTYFVLGIPHSLHDLVLVKCDVKRQISFIWI